MRHDKSQQLFNQAQQHLVGGVNSPVRAYQAVGGNPVFIKKGEGSHVVCEDNQSYIDYVLSYGPLLLGHAHPTVLAALADCMPLGTTFGAPTYLETELALAIKSFYPYVDKVRFVSSGTEASMSAIRLARGVTKRSIVVKFKGCYHGHVDSLLVSAGSGSATLGVADSAGVLLDSVSHTAVLDYNNAQQVQDFFAEHGNDVACILMEPVAGNMGVIVPDLEFVSRCRTCCDDVGALLIFDEVMCGFRTQRSGTHEWIGVEPDMVILGKVIGGGLPCGAFAAKAAIMDHVAPLGPVYQAGTLSGNPLAMAAGIATLYALEDGSVFEMVNRYTTELVAGIRDRIASLGISAVVSHQGSMFTVFFRDHLPRTFTDVQTCDFDRFKQFFHGMLGQGIFLPPSQYEACFTSVGHDEDDLSKTLSSIYHVLTMFNKSV
ncbi:glutamate-1-semialdehyde-2,1-aminomutase [Candidatus Marinamargulisbacteria bacterium SCGC AG-333-B06]|nr:glutamate-1-semialdehyde-2,1-aminomutase [Candidatus Marinamargulisbacteria bacterium SCGC AG-333-B06]